MAGDVGSGKTSLLYGIEMALFGFAEVDAAFLVRHLAKEAEVRLLLEDATHRYELTRRFTRRSRRGKDVFELEENAFAVDGAKRTYSTTELRQRAIDLLGFPDNPNPRAHSDLWRWAVYIPQERMREVLDQKPEDRLETVRKALGLEQYRTAADNALEVASDLRRTAVAREDEVQALGHWAEERPRWIEVKEARRREIIASLPVSEQLRSRLADLEREAALIEAERRAIAEEEREGKALSEELAHLARRITELVRTTAGRTAEIERLRAEAANVPSPTERLATLRETEAATLQERDALRHRHRVLEDARRTLAGAEAELDAARRAEASATDDQGRAQAERGEAEALLETLAREGPLREPPAPTSRSIGEIDRTLADAQSAIDRTHAEVVRLEVELKETDELLRAGVCPRCHQAVAEGAFSSHREESARALAERRGELARVEAERDRLKEERSARERYERDRDRFVQVEARRDMVRKNLATLDGRLSGMAQMLDDRRRALGAVTARAAAAATDAAGFPDVERDLTRIERKLDELAREVEAMLTSVERARSASDRVALLMGEAEREQRAMEEAAQRRAALTHRLSEIAKRTPRGPELAQQSDEIARERTRITSELEVSGRRIAHLESQEEEAVRRIAEADQGIAERGRVSAIVAHHRALAQWLSGPFRESVLTLEHRLLARAQDDFDRSFSRYFATLIEDPALVARCDVAFTPLVEIDGEWTPPEALSGGERTALALAYRLALGQVVRSAGRLKLDTIILDEPTDGFSPEQVSRMGELLDEIGLPQVVLVSHEGSLASVADRIVRVHKDDGVSAAEPDERDPRPRSDAAVREAGAPAASPLTPRRRRSRSPRLDDSSPGPTPETR